MNQLENGLYDRLMSAIRICQDELGWNPLRAIQMVNQHGPVEAAIKIVTIPGGTDGFARCWESGRLDVSVENVILDPDFDELFSADILNIARLRIDEARRNPPRNRS